MAPPIPNGFSLPFNADPSGSAPWAGFPSFAPWASPSSTSSTSSTGSTSLSSASLSSSPVTSATSSSAHVSAPSSSSTVAQSSAPSSSSSISPVLSANSGHLSSGTIAAIALSAAIGVVFLIYICWRLRRRPHFSPPTVTPLPPMASVVVDEGTVTTSAGSLHRQDVIVNVAALTTQDGEWSANTARRDSWASSAELIPRDSHDPLLLTERDQPRDAPRRGPRRKARGEAGGAPNQSGERSRPAAQRSSRVPGLPTPGWRNPQGNALASTERGRQTPPPPYHDDRADGGEQ